MKSPPTTHCRISPLKRLALSLRRQGLLGTLVKMSGPFFDARFDRKYGLDTCAIEELDSVAVVGSKETAGRYQPSRVMPARKALLLLKQQVPDATVLVDFGCGKGRVLLLASETGFRVARGVEFAREFCDIAKKNVAAYQKATGTKTEFQIIHADASQYVIREEENLFFFWNPFHPPIFRQVLSNIAASLQSRPRRIHVLISLPSQEYQQLMTERSEFALCQVIRCWGYDFFVYASV